MNYMDGKLAFMVFFSNINYYRNMGLVKRTSKVKNLVDDWRYIAFHKKYRKEMEFDPKINQDGIKLFHQTLNSDCVEI